MLNEFGSNNEGVVIKARYKWGWRVWRFWKRDWFAFCRLLHAMGQTEGSGVTPEQADIMRSAIFEQAYQKWPTDNSKDFLKWWYRNIDLPDDGG